MPSKFPIVQRVEVTSHTTPDKSYTVTIYDGTKPWCSCPAHRFKPKMRPCKHLVAILSAANSFQQEKVSTEQLPEFDFRFLDGASVSCSHVDNTEWFDFNLG